MATDHLRVKRVLDSAIRLTDNKTTVDLYHSTKGFKPAGSGLCHVNEHWGVSMVIQDRIHGRQFKTLSEAQNHFDSITF